MAEEKKEEKKPAQAKIDINNDKPVFSWKAPEYLKSKRNPRKILFLLVVAIVLGAVFVWQKQWSGIVVICAAAFVLAVMTKARAKEMGCAVYHVGLIVDEKVHNFDQFKSFWIVFTDRAKIKLQFTGKFAGQLTIPVSEEEDPEQIRLFLSKHLPEEEGRGEDLPDLINRIMRL